MSTTTNIYMAISDPAIGNGDAKNSDSTFPCLSISYSAVAPVSANDTAVGNPSMGPITVTLNADLGPTLLNSLLQRQTHSVQFDFVQTTSISKGIDTIFETITLNEATITLFQETCSAGDASPILELSFAYRALRFTEGSLSATYSVSGGGELG